MQPKIYKSHLGLSVGDFYLSICVLGSAAYIILDYNDFKIWDITLSMVIKTVVIIGVVQVIYTGLFNHDFYVYDDYLEVVNPHLFFKKKIKIPFNQIKRIDFLEGDTFYKWVTIYADKKYRVYCFGMDREHYEDSVYESTFEDFYSDLRKKGLNVCWS